MRLPDVHPLRAGHVSGYDTARDLEQTLRGHYLPPNKPPGGLFATEIQSPDGRRRADALWMPLTTAGGHGIIGHELKVSRSDVLAELTDPTKAEPWSQYCNRWWLVVSDPALVTGLDIPEAWGIMAPPSGRRTRSMTIVRPAPRLDPKDPTLAYRRLMAWQVFGSHARIARLERLENDARVELERTREQLAEVRHHGETPSPHAQRIWAIVADVEKRMRDHQLWGTADDTLIADVVLEATAVRRAHVDLHRDLAALHRMVVEPARGALASIERAQSLLGDPDDVLTT